jgi:hypothetical protein
MHPVGFIIRIYHGARSPERQMCLTISLLFFQRLETDVVRAAEVGMLAQAARMEQNYEDEILQTAVKKLAAHRGNKVKQAQDVRELKEMVRRDKRAVELLGNLLGGSSGVSLQH